MSCVSLEERFYLGQQYLLSINSSCLDDFKKCLLDMF